MLLSYGFEQPTPEIMQKWQQWFESIADIQVEQGGFKNGVHIDAQGTKELAWDQDCITGYNIIEAESMEAAVEIAQTNPFISGIRVYELR